MPKINDLTNKRFGNLIALKRTKSSTHGYYWLCQCDCGNQKEILGYNLISQNTKSCGKCKQNNKKKLQSQQKRKNPKNQFSQKDLSNQQFGCWVALYPTRQNTSGNYYWYCKCSCGTEREVLEGSLQSGKSKSCGCIRSHGEKKISSILREYQINFQQEYYFPNCLTENNYPCRFDFAIFDKNDKLQYLIEYDGKQHFEEGSFNLKKNQTRDAIKNNYCLNNNILLYRIPYTDLSDINELEDILNNKYLIN